MIVYEVYIKVQADLVEQFETYMKQQHIPDMIETGYFLDAEFNTVLKGKYCLRATSRLRELKFRGRF